MIEFALTEDKPEIREIWDIAFPEDNEFNNWFFENKFRAEYTLVYRNKGMICSMAQLLPYEISGFGWVSYIYGAATRPEYRRQGLMERLLRQSHEIDRERGFAGSILIPENKGLFDYYGRLGYKTAFYVAHKSYDCAESGKFNVKKAGEEDIPFMDSLYRESVGEQYIVRTRDRWQEQLRMYNEIYGGAYILLENGVREAYCFYTGEDMAEIFGRKKNILCSVVNKGRVTECTEGGGNIPYGMLLSYGEKISGNMYIGLMFD